MNTEILDVKRGVERLARVYCWPNDPTIADKDKYEFRALSEFVIFNAYVKKTFFDILHADLRNQTANLYLHLLSSIKEDTPLLTFKEAFLLFRLIGKKQTRSILDAISCPPSKYNGILESIENLDFKLFKSSFENYDNRQMFQVLWKMRYILYGTNYAWEHFEPIEQLSSIRFNEWSRGEANYQSYFCEIPEKDEDDFVRQKVLAIVGFEDSSNKKKRIRRLKHIPSNEDIVGEYINYIDKESGKSLFHSQWKELLAEINYNSDLPDRNSRVNTSYIEDLARLILTHNVILHKDKVMEIFGIDSSEVHNQFRNTEVYIYESGDCKDLGRYILCYTREMLYIYNNVETIMNDDSKKELKSILSRLECAPLFESVVFSSASQKMDDFQKIEDETIESCKFTPIEQEMGEKPQIDNDKQCNNSESIKKAIILGSPSLPTIYRELFCKMMAAKTENCTWQMIDYFLWGDNEEPQRVISKDNPMIWKDTVQKLVAYIRFPYIDYNNPKNSPNVPDPVIESLNVAIVIKKKKENQPFVYKSLSLSVLEGDIDKIKKEIKWKDDI